MLMKLIEDLRIESKTCNPRVTRTQRVKAYKAFALLKLPPTTGTKMAMVELMMKQQEREITNNKTKETTTRGQD